MKKAAANKVAKVMREYKAGTLHAGKNPAGAKKAPLAKSRKQAIAIALSEANAARGKKVTESKTGESYSSRAAKVKHERTEKPAQRKAEYGSKYKKGMR